MTDDEFEAHFAGLRDKFRERLPFHHRRLVELRNRYVRSPDEEVVWDLKRVAHEIAGTGGTFGYPELSEIAAELEAAADAVTGNGEQPTAVIVPLRQLIRELELLL